jgi:putative DNA methylase
LRLRSFLSVVSEKSERAAIRVDFLRALRREMPDALAEIRRAGVGLTDIQQAAIGPDIGIFTRYAQVLNTDGTPMLVKDALKLINQVREEITAPATGEYDPETLFALDWFAAKGFEKGRSGDAIVMTSRCLTGRHERGRVLSGRRWCRTAPKARRAAGGLGPGQG